MENNDLPNYNLCILCQNETNEKLINPAANEKVKGYKTLASNLALFHKLGELPFSLKIVKKCLKSCRNKCNCSKRQLKCTELCNCGANCK